MKKKITKPFNWYLKLRRRNKIIVGALLIIILLVVAMQIQQSTARPEFVTEQVRKADIVEIVSETGNVNAAGRVDVFSSSTGVIEEIYINNDSEVLAGQDLFRVRSTATDQEKAQSYAAYQSALSGLKNAEQSKLTYDAQMWQAQKALLDAKNAQNYKDDNSLNPMTGDDYTELEQESIDTSVVQAEKNFRSLEKMVLEADTAIQAAQAQVNSALLAFQATSDVIVKSPASGTVTNLSLRVGDNVKADSGMSMPTLMGESSSPVLTIANLNDYSIKVSLNEIDIPKVSVGQTVVVTIDAFKGREFNGRVEHVDAVGTNNQGVVTYTVLVTIINPHPNIRPGMTANVDIEVDKRTGVLAVSNSAVKPYQGGRGVRIYNEETNEVEFIPVEIGVRGNDKTEIVKGLSENQEIIVSLPNDQIKRPSLF